MSAALSPPVPTAVLLGGRGFLGGFLAEHLREKKRAVVLINDRQELADFLAGCSGRYQVYHLAHRGIPGTPLSSPLHEESLLYFREVLRTVESRPPETFVFFSSGGAIYGPSASSLLTEDHACRPICTYGQTKLAMETEGFSWAQRRRTRFLVVRPGNAYGPGQETLSRGAGFPAAILRAAFEGRSLTVFGPPGVVRDFIHAEDVAEGAFRVAEQGEGNQIYHLGTGRGICTEEILQLMGDLLPRRFRSFPVIRKSPRSCDVPRAVLSTVKTAQTTGWRSRISLEKGILDWIRILEKKSRNHE